MNDYEVVGIRKIDYVSKKTGRQVKATELHCLCSDDKCYGMLTEKFFVPDRLSCDHIHLNDHIKVYFNRYGSIDFIQVL